MVQVQAQGGCLYGFLLGFYLGGDDQATAGINSNIVYTLPDLNKRLGEKYWLDIMQVSCRLNHAPNKISGFSFGSRSMKDIFRYILAKQIEKDRKKIKLTPDDYIILQVTKQICPSTVDHAGWWFAYIEKDKVGPVIIE